jgi:hypothetical protein
MWQRLDERQAFTIFKRKCNELRNMSTEQMLYAQESELKTERQQSPSCRKI